MDRGAWWAIVHAVAKSQTRLSDFHTLTHIHTINKKSRYRLLKLICARHSFTSFIHIYSFNSDYIIIVMYCI